MRPDYRYYGYSYPPRPAHMGQLDDWSSGNVYGGDYYASDVITLPDVSLPSDLSLTSTYDPFANYWQTPQFDVTEPPPAPSDYTMQIGSESCLERWSPGCEFAPPNYLPLYNPWDFPPYTPTFPEPPAPPPASAQNLPGYCPQGQYHPYPIGDPRQDVCVPFPSAPTGTQQPRPTQTPAPASAPRPPAQQPQQLPKCPTGYKRDPWTLQCVPQRQQQQQQCSPGYHQDFFTGQCAPDQQHCAPSMVFDQRSGRCVIAPPPPQAQQTDQSTTGDLLSELSKLPWWLWAGLAAFLLLGQGEEKKRVTVQHRKSS